jgi:hypothetical protein
LSQAERRDDVVHRALPVDEDVQDLPASGLGHRVERICRRCCSCHVAAIIYRYRNMSTGKTSRSLSVVQVKRLKERTMEQQGIRGKIEVRAGRQR